jgi:hypothetical protein
MEAAPVERAVASSRSSTDVGTVGVRAAAKQTSKNVFSLADAKCAAAKQTDETVKESSPITAQPAATATRRSRARHDRQQKGGLDQALIGRLGSSALCRQLETFVSKLLAASRRCDIGAESYQQWAAELEQLAHAALLFPGNADVDFKLFTAVDCLSAYTDDVLAVSDSDYDDAEEEAEFGAEFGDTWQQPFAWEVGNRGGRGEGLAGAPLSPCESRADHYDEPLHRWTEEDELE